MPFPPPGGSSQPSDQTRSVMFVIFAALAGGFLTTSTTWKADIHMIPYGICLSLSDLLSSIVSFFFFKSKPQVELNTSFLKTGSATRNEFNHKIVPISQP